MNKVVTLVVTTLFLLMTPECLATETLEDVAPYVAYLEQESIEKKADGTPVAHYGTGVFMAHNQRGYLVTAKHVATLMSATAQVVVQGENDIPVSLRFSDLIGNAANVNWVYHGEADVAVLPLTPTKKEYIGKILKNHFMPSSCLIPGGTAPSRETVLTTLGFPLQLGIQGRFSPLSKESKPATEMINIPDTGIRTPFLLLQDPSISGFSGAPVLSLGGLKTITTSTGTAMTQEDNARCYGIVQGVRGDLLQWNPRLKVTVPVPVFALVTPSKFVLETLDKAEKQVMEGQVKTVK